MRKHLLSIFGLIALLCIVPIFTSTAGGQSQTKEKLISDWLVTEPDGFWDVIWKKGPDYEIVERKYSLTITHTLTTYTEHILSVIMLIENQRVVSTSFFWIDVREFEESIGGKARQDLHWNIGDVDRDGLVDSALKQFHLYSPTEGYILPHYPEGYLNREWARVTQEEAQKVFEVELNFWMNYINKWRKEV